MEFREWLFRTKTSLSTIKHYSGAIYGRLSDICSFPIYEVRDTEEFKSIFDSLKKDDDFIRLNEKGHRMYTAALNKYMTFLQSRQCDENSLFIDVHDIERDNRLEKTEKLMMVKARLGQGRYRNRLLEIWDGKCSVTGYDDPRLLVASHIKPWYCSDNRERICCYNGLMLTPTLDKVFDIGLITFDPEKNGKIQISEGLKDPEALGLDSDMHLRDLPESCVNYLKWHEKNIFLRY